MRILVTGGAGFIGSAVVRHLILETEHTVLNLDALTYAGNLESLAGITDHPRHSFYQTDLRDLPELERLLAEEKPEAILHLAAESHVDRSIESPGDFIDTNVVGTLNLLHASLGYWKALPAQKKESFRFLHVSTDEVYGDLPADPAILFTEETAYAPSSPYAASKASSDHLVRAWHRTYGLPTLITNCSNNYGPHQFPEKLIPHMILNTLAGKPLPLYGDGTQIRDWLYVEDHVRALMTVLEKAEPGTTYNIGGHNELTNKTVVETLCTQLEELAPDRKPSGCDRYSELITYVPDRPGHDLRYAIDASKIQRELGWTPQETFPSGIKKTVQWYLENQEWWQNILSGEYQLARLGQAEEIN